MKKKKLISAIMAATMATSAMTAFSAAAEDTDTTGNGILTAEEISMNEVISTNLSGDDNDWYKFTLDTPCKLNITVDLSEANGVGSYFEIVDADNDDTTVFTHKGFNDEATLRDIVYLTAGNYYIHFHGAPYSGCDYSLNLVSTPTEESFDSKSNNNIGDASPVKFLGTYTGQISVNDDADYYTFKVYEEGKVTFTFRGDLANVDWKLYNSDAKVVQSGVFTEAESDNSIYNIKSYVLTEGTFTLGITKNKDESCGNYKLSFDYLKDYNSRSEGEAFACMDINKDHLIDANDASAVLSYYAYLSTGGTESDMNIWYETIFVVNE